MQRRKNYAMAVAGMLAGSTAVFGLLMVINQLATADNAEAERRASQIEIEKLQKPAPERVVRERRPPPRRQPQGPPPPSLAALDSALGGLDVGLPGFDLGDLDDLSDELLGDMKDVVMTSDTVDQAPRPVRRAAMAYPFDARSKALEGYVELSILVDEDGEIEQIRVVDSSPSGVFDAAALDGVREWRFEPGLYRGERVATWIRQRVAFQLS